MLMREAAKEYKWNLNYGGIALMWRGGCIIRSAFLGKIKEAFDRNPNLSNLLLDEYFRGVIERCQGSWRGWCQGRRDGRAGAGLHDRPGVLRRLPQRSGCPPTCCRPSATTSARTPTSASTSRAANSSTPTGPARGGNVAASTYTA